MVRRSGSALLALALISCATTGGQRGEETIATQPLTALEQQLVDDAVDRHLTRHDLLDAALIASGASTRPAS